MMTTETMGIVAVTARDRLALSEVLARPGTRTVLLAGSKDPNAKMTLILLDGYGAAFAVKVPTNGESARVVQEEGELLEAIRRLPIVEKGKPVGIVSLGDLALERDSKSALADITAAPGNA